VVIWICGIWFTFTVRLLMKGRVLSEHCEHEMAFRLGVEED
jgi:hypothetical protein